MLTFIAKEFDIYFVGVKDESALDYDLDVVLMGLYFYYPLWHILVLKYKYGPSQPCRPLPILVALLVVYPEGPNMEWAT